MDQIDLVVMTSDKYLHALPVFAHLFNKYWDKEQRVLVAGFSPPLSSLPSNFFFHSIGKFSDYPVNRWSDSLIDLMHQIDLQTFVLMLEDYWLVRKVDTRAVKILYDYAKQFQYVMKIDLCGDRLYSANMSEYGYVEYIDLIKGDPSAQYHMSLMTGVWNRDQLLRFLMPGETPWQVELEGTNRVRAAGNETLHLGTRQWPVRHTLGLRSGDPSNFFVTELQQHDVQELRNLNLL